MGVRVLEGRAEREIDAPLERCLEVLRDVECWPDWISTVSSVAVLERDDSGRPAQVVVEARLVGLPLWFAADVSVGEPGELTIRRVPHDESDPERLELAVRLEETAAAACRATATLSAGLEVPRLVPLPGAVADQVAGRLLADLAGRMLGP